MNWRLIAFEMGLFWNEPLRSKNARRANVLWTNALRANVLRTNAEGECPKGECASTNARRANVLWTNAEGECLRRESKTILFTK